MSNNKSEYSGSILSVRAVEDSIRNAKKYTEGVLTMFKKHPVQGMDFPSPVFYKHYEVYPEVEVSLDMPVGKWFEWQWQNTPRITVLFHYDYRPEQNKAFIVVRDGMKGVKILADAIPGFSGALARVVANGNKPEE